MAWNPELNASTASEWHAYAMGWNDANGGKKRRNRPYNSDELCIIYEKGYLDQSAPTPPAEVEV